jgi:RNA polymerase sigma-70 factor (ECF subfamily)
VFSIATNVAMDYLRLPAHRQRIVDMEEAAEIADGDRPLDDQLVIGEMNQCVRGVIDSLPADYRAALILHDLEGMSGEQTARIIGCSLNAAKVRVHRARARLKDALQEQCSFYRDDDGVLRCTRD